MKRKSWKLWILTALVFSLACSIVGMVTANAGDQGKTIITGVMEIIEESAPDVNTEKSATDFVNRILGRGNILHKSSSGLGTQLAGADLNLYNRLLADIIDVANGDRESTIFTYSFSEIYPQTSFTAQDLHVTDLFSNDTLSNEAKAAIQAKLEELSFRERVSKCLLQDCSYSLYWYDKTSKAIQKTDWRWSTDNWITVEIDGTIMVSMPVSQDYAKDNNVYQVDSATYGQAARSAAANAQKIVDAHENEENYTRLLSYKNAICELTDYYDDITVANSMPYGNPWQVVWVFDDNPDTKVVCEGYSKAFKYLNDLSPKSSVNVILAEGTISMATGSRAHMWNIVQMEDGCNYLVDVTNCDNGSIGSPNLLFLKGPASGNVSEGYSFICNNSKVSYSYSGNNYGTDRITLSAFDYLNRPSLSSKNGLTMDDDGNWRYYENNEFVAKSGIVEYEGGQFFVANGVLCSTANGLNEFGGQWYFLAGGQVQAQQTGLAEYGGEWFYIDKGILDINRRGIVNHDGGQFMIAAGRILREANGLIQDPNTGIWYFVSAGQVAANYRGLALYDEHWFYVWDGVFQSDAEGWVDHDGATFYVIGGMVQMDSELHGAAPEEKVEEEQDESQDENKAAPLQDETTDDTAQNANTEIQTIVEPVVVDETESEQAAHELSVEEPVAQDKTADGPAVEKTPAEPVVDEVPAEPVAEETPAEPVVEEVPEEPAFQDAPAVVQPIEEPVNNEIDENRQSVQNLTVEETVLQEEMAVEEPVV